jgi:nucleoside-diphosphate-sugar epimerase
MKVFVAGASGALGKPVVRELIARRHEVVGMTSTESKRWMVEGLGASAVVGDVFDAAAMVELVRSAEPEGVVNLASKWSVYPTRISQVTPANEIREQGARNVVAAAAAAGVRRYLNESMVFVYGYGDHSQPLSEDQPPGQERRRGLQRVIEAIVAAEHVVRERSEQGEIEGACMRFGFFHGRHADSTQRMFDLVRKRRLPLIGTGDSVRSWIELEDAASAVVDALERAPAGSVYNVVDDEPVVMRDYIGEIARLTGSKPARRMPYWLVNIGASYVAPAFGRGRLPISNAKLKQELGWSPRYPTYRDALRAAFVAAEPATEAAGPTAARR